MSDMTGLKQSILEQSHEKGRLGLAAAREKVQADFEQKKAQLLLEKEAYRASQLNDINRRVQREKQQMENQARQSTLATKQAVLKELFEAAEAQLSDWSEEEEVSFFRQVLSAYSEEVTVRFGQITANRLSEAVREELKAAYPQVTFEEETISGQAGFLISQGQVDDNYLYSSLIADLWEEEGFRLAADIFKVD